MGRDLADCLRGWAGLRNVIAHVYRRLDLEVLYRAYAAEVDDLDAYAGALQALS